MNTKPVTNQEIIASWDTYPESEIIAFGDEGDFSRQYLLNPVLMDLLDDVSGKQILDAGSGTGYLSRKLTRAGANITAIEPAKNFFTYAQQREQQDPLGITYIQADLSDIKLPADSFDIVIANMVLMDIPRYQEAIKNCIQALKPHGLFIFSILHPCFDEENNQAYRDQEYIKVTDYFHERQDAVRFGKTFHRSLSTYINVCIQQGLTLQKLIEPQLADEVAVTFPDQIRNTFIPSFLIVSWQKQEK